MDGLPIFVPIGFAVLLLLAVAGIVITVRRDARRKNDLRRVVPSLELSAVVPEELVRGQRAGEAAVWDAAGAAFGLTPHNRGIVDNLYHGTAGGRDTWLFDFTYSRVPGPGGSRFVATVASLGLRAPLPQFRMFPEGGLARVAAAVGGQDIDFPGDPEFSRSYVLWAEDEAAVRGLFSPALTAFLASRPGMSLASFGDRLVCHSESATDGRVPVADLPAFLERAREVAARFES